MLPARLSAEGYDGGRAGRAAGAAGAGGATATPGGQVPVPGGAVGCWPADDFDPDEAARRIERRARRARGEIERLEKKLAQRGFVEKAPAEVVEGERAKLDDYRRRSRRL